MRHATAHLSKIFRSIVRREICAQRIHQNRYSVRAFHMMHAVTHRELQDYAFEYLLCRVKILVGPNTLRSTMAINSL